MKMPTKIARFVPCLLAGLLLPAMAMADAQAFVTSDAAGPGFGGPQDCTGFEAYQQPLDAANFGTARTSDQETGFAVAEAFLDGAGTITPLSGSTGSLRWWGINFDFIATFCTDDDDAGTPFDITFYNDTPDVGNVIASVTGVAPTIVDTGIPFAATTIGEFSATFADTDVTGATWVVIERQTGVAGCNWLWVDETLVGSYDDDAWQGAIGLGTDQTVCLGGPAGQPVIEVPTINEVGLVTLLLALFATGIFVLRRRQGSNV